LYSQTPTPAPATSSTIATTLQVIAAVVGSLPAAGSYGQSFV
jgi:hypothetical protein